MRDDRRAALKKSEAADQLFLSEAWTSVSGQKQIDDSTYEMASNNRNHKLMMLKVSGRSSGTWRFESSATLFMLAQDILFNLCSIVPGRMVRHPKNNGEQV